MLRGQAQPPSRPTEMRASLASLASLASVLVQQSASPLVLESVGVFRGLE